MPQVSASLGSTGAWSTPTNDINFSTFHNASFKTSDSHNSWKIRCANNHSNGSIFTVSWVTFVFSCFMYQYLCSSTRELPKVYGHILGVQILSLEWWGKIRILGKLGYYMPKTWLVFRRKDLCEAKHDLGVRKMCSKTTLCSHYTTLWGGGGGQGKA